MSVVPVDFQDSVNDFNVGVNESIFYLFCMLNNAYECPKVLLNVDSNAKIVIESDLCADVRIFALMNVSWHYWSSFHANDYVFYRNEQQKVYYNVMLGNFVFSFFLFCHHLSKCNFILNFDF